MFGKAISHYSLRSAGIQPSGWIRRLPRGYSLAAREPSQRHISCAHGADQQAIDKSLHTDENIAIRQLQQVFQNGLLDRGHRSTERTRKLARKPNRTVALASATPWRDFVEHVPSGEEGVDYARETMLSFHSWLKDMPIREAQAEIENASLGRQTLNWLLTADQNTKHACGWDLDLLALLAHYVIAERRDSSFWDWLRQEMAGTWFPRDPVEREKIGVRYGWVGRLMANIVEVYLARDVSGNADSALQLLISFDELRFNTPAARVIHYGAMSAAIERNIQPGLFTNTNPQLYDRWLDICFSELKTKNAKTGLDTAIRHLAHPTKPDLDPLLTHFRSIDAEAREFHPKSAHEAAWERSICEALTDMLEGRSRSADADFARGLAKRFELIHLKLSRGTRSQTIRKHSPAHPTVDGKTLETTPSDLLLMRKRRRAQEKQP